MAECCGCGKQYSMVACSLDAECVGLCELCRADLELGKLVRQTCGDVGPACEHWNDICWSEECKPSEDGAQRCPCKNWKLKGNKSEGNTPEEALKGDQMKIDWEKIVTVLYCDDTESFRLEDLYQAFKNRMVEELVEEAAKFPLKGVGR